MSDLFFSQGKDLASQLNLLRDELLKYAKTLKYNKKKLPLLFGDISSVGNNFLFILPPFKGEKHFEDDSFKKLDELLTKYNIIKNCITYAHVIPLERHTKAHIKEFSIWIERIVEIIQPKAIVAIGEDAALLFSRRKILLRDNHGQRISTLGEIPVYLTYPMEYYTDKSSYENTSFKQFIESYDWSFLQNKYKELICQ